MLDAHNKDGSALIGISHPESLYKSGMGHEAVID